MKYTDERRAIALLEEVVRSGHDALVPVDIVNPHWRPPLDEYGNTVRRLPVGLLPGGLIEQIQAFLVDIGAIES